MSGTESKWCMGGKFRNVSVGWVIRDRVGNVRESQGKTSTTQNRKGVGKWGASQNYSREEKVSTTIGQRQENPGGDQG